MRHDVRTVRRSLKALDLKRGQGGTSGHHEVWKNDKGRKVELGKDGNDVPALFVHILSGQLEMQGICTKRDFKRLLRQA